MTSTTRVSSVLSINKCNSTLWPVEKTLETILVLQVIFLCKTDHMLLGSLFKIIYKKLIFIFTSCSGITTSIFFYFNTLYHVSFIIFVLWTNKCTIISQFFTLLHVSTLSCLPQTACNQYLAKLHKYFKFSCW